MIENKKFMKKMHEAKFDVGVAEWIADNAFAFLIFHALNIPNVINTKGIEQIKFTHNARHSKQLSRRTHWNWTVWN
jgi:hypothetical protein